MTGVKALSGSDIGPEVIAQLLAKARELGLDPFEMRFEICPAEILYTFGAYGMPTRFSHWSFGKAWHRIKTEYDYNLSRIYELVINTDPCYAFLLEGNSPIQNKLVCAHALGHSDFFKHNAYFAPTSRRMLDTMEAAAGRICGYEMTYGRERVEEFLDAALALQEHINPYMYEHREAPAQDGAGPRSRAAGRGTPYDDLWALDAQSYGKCETADVKAPFPPEKDLLLFLIQHARELDDWQRDILGVIRDEARYFWPQMETKIVNEGWATFWHLRILREIDLPESEALEFARMHADLIQGAKFKINPYLLGLTLLEDIEKRYGREKLFEIRSTCNDVSFLRNYLTKEIVERLDLYVYRRVGHEWRVVEKNWERVRDTLVENLVNCGYPYIVAADSDHNRRGELYLRHLYEGVELDVLYLEKTLPYVHRIWARPVHFETVLEEKPVVFSYNGERVIRRFI
ncbi:SpoVR family protein [Desulforudis sp. 1088]|uniref:SpoVR family protein n=1 Tax=Desulforudis sp. 1088 TaxID=3416137 RepID=UPI003CF620C8